MKIKLVRGVKNKNFVKKCQSILRLRLESSAS
jgi:hypothetical protein